MEQKFVKETNKMIRDLQAKITKQECYDLHVEAGKRDQELLKAHRDRIRRLIKENKEWQICYEQEVELGNAQYVEMRNIPIEMRNIAMAIHDRELAALESLGQASQHGVNWRILCLM